MKLSDIPERAFTAAPTPIPTKVVPDWDALYQILLRQGFVVIESDEIRATKTGEVKSFNNHVRVTKRVRLQTKRITGTKWFCCLNKEKRNDDEVDVPQIETAFGK